MLNGLKTSMTLPNLQVTPKAERRRFSAEYKLNILAEADGCTTPPDESTGGFPPNG